MRRMTRAIRCGSVQIGGDAPVSIQSMTNTDTRDIEATVRQIRALAEEGCQIVRVAIPDQAAAKALGQIKAAVSLPVVADIHFDYRLALAAIAARRGTSNTKVKIGTRNTPPPSPSMVPSTPAPVATPHNPMVSATSTSAPLDAPQAAHSDQ